MRFANPVAPEHDAGCADAHHKSRKKGRAKKAHGHVNHATFVEPISVWYIHGFGCTLAAAAPGAFQTPELRLDSTTSAISENWPTPATFALTDVLYLIRDASSVRSLVVCPAVVAQKSVDAAFGVRVTKTIRLLGNSAMVRSLPTGSHVRLATGPKYEAPQPATAGHVCRNKTVANNAIRDGFTIWRRHSLYGSYLLYPARE
jgi:hypothetical protein